MFLKLVAGNMHRPRGPMDKAPDYESEDCGFESHRGQVFQGSKFPNVRYYQNSPLRVGFEPTREDPI